MVESIKELKRICDKGEKEHWYIQYVMRGAAIYLTKLFLKLGVSANQVTLIAMSFSMLGGIFMAAGGYVYAIVGALLFNVWLLFDNADGQIARYHRLSNPFGAILDSVSADISYALLFIAAGIGVYGSPGMAQFAFSAPLYDIFQVFDPAIFIVLGAIASLSKILDRHIDNKFAFILSAGSDAVQTDNGGKIALNGRLKTAVIRMEFNIFNQGGLLLLLVLVAAVLDLLPVWVVFNGVCVPGLFIARMIIRIRSYM